MPSLAKSNKWFFRITLSHVNIQTLWNSALSTIKLIDVERCLIVSHVGEKTDKEHCHGLIHLNKVLQKQSLDVRLKSIFGVSGADYSSKEWDGGMEHGAGSYLYHDKSAKELYNKGFTQEELDTFRKCNDDVQVVVEENKSRASGRCVERLLKLITESNRTWTRSEIAFKLLQDIRNDAMYECGDYVLKKYIEEIYSKQLQGTDWTTYANMRVQALIGNSEEFSSY